MRENIAAYALMMGLGIAAAFSARRKKKRYGGYKDPIKFRMGVRFSNGLGKKRPEDELYSDDGRINRHWKP